MTQTSLSQTQGSIQLGTLAREAGIALVIQFAGVVLTYLVQVFLARWMGRIEYGVYEYVVAWSVLLAIPAGLGLPHTVLRFVSEYRVKEEWGLLRGLVRSSWLITVLASFWVSLLASGVILALNYYHPFDYATPLLIGLGLVLLRALVNLQLETGRATRDIPLAYAPSRVIWPVLLLCGGFLFLKTSHSLTGISAIAIAEITLSVAVLFQLGWLLFKLNQDVEASQPVYAIREWLDVAVVVLLQTACFIVLSNTDTIMVGSILGPEQAGLYAAAGKTAQWATFVLSIVNIVAAPSFTALYIEDDIEGLQTVVSTVGLWIFWPSAIVAVLLMVFSQPILGLFGSEFMAASWQLKILVAGNLVNALCGSVAYLMVMTGHQNKSVKVFAYAVAINIALNAIAIPLMGALGAAIATAFATALWNIWLSFLVLKYVGVSPWVFKGLFQWNASKSKIES